jgi:hypothetical protein
MAFSDFERNVNLGALKWFIEHRRPPEHIRPQLDIGYSVVGQTVDVFEIRPDWQDKSTTRHTPVARVRFVRTQEVWKLYWMRRDLKWHKYEPVPIHSTLKSALSTIHEDAYCCFFG